MPSINLHLIPTVVLLNPVSKFLRPTMLIQNLCHRVQIQLQIIPNKLANLSILMIPSQPFPYQRIPRRIYIYIDC